MVMGNQETVMKIYLAKSVETLKRTNPCQKKNTKKKLVINLAKTQRNSENVV